MNRPFEEKMADVLCTLALIGASLYFFGHLLFAWLDGRFEVLK